MSKQAKSDSICPRVRIQTVHSHMWCAMAAIEAGNAITAADARPTLGKRKEPPCIT